MPRLPLSPCRHAGCKALTDSRFCQDHEQDKSKYDRIRGSATRRGYDAQWRKAREIYLANNPLCVMCKDDGKLTTASVVDHIIPHRGNMLLFWDTRNWQSLCTTCHNSTKKRMENK